jgi:hypothetical protein
MATIGDMLKPTETGSNLLESLRKAAPFQEGTTPKPYITPIDRVNQKLNNPLSPQLQEEERQIKEIVKQYPYNLDPDAFARRVLRERLANKLSFTDYFDKTFKPGGRPRLNEPLPISVDQEIQEMVGRHNLFVRQQRAAEKIEDPIYKQQNDEAAINHIRNAAINYHTDKLNNPLFGTDIYNPSMARTDFINGVNTVLSKLLNEDIMSRYGALAKSVTKNGGNATTQLQQLVGSQLVNPALLLLQRDEAVKPLLNSIDVQTLNNALTNIITDVIGQYSNYRDNSTVQN